MTDVDHAPSLSHSRIEDLLIVKRAVFYSRVIFSVNPRHGKSCVWLFVVALSSMCCVWIVNVIG